MYELRIAAGAARALARLPLEEARRLDAVIRALGDEPRPHGCRKLKGRYEGWRVRAGPYRVLYRVDDEARTVTIYTVGRRRDIYR